MFMVVYYDIGSIVWYVVWQYIMIQEALYGMFYGSIS
jgi:hypothetical protein